MKGTYRALGIATVLALLGAILNLALAISRHTAYATFLEPSANHVAWVEFVNYYRSFADYGAVRLASLFVSIWAILALTVAAQSRRNRWLAALITLEVVWISLPIVYLIARYGFAVPHTTSWLLNLIPMSWAVLIISEVATLVFVATRPRQTSSPAVTVPVVDETSAVSDNPAL